MDTTKVQVSIFGTYRRFTNRHTHAFRTLLVDTTQQRAWRHIRAQEFQDHSFIYRIHRKGSKHMVLVVEKGVCSACMLLKTFCLLLTEVFLPQRTNISSSIPSNDYRVDRGHSAILIELVQFQTALCDVAIDTHVSYKKLAVMFAAVRCITARHFFHGK